jgi:hypothetical protein
MGQFELSEKYVKAFTRIVKKENGTLFVVDETYTSSIDSSHSKESVRRRLRISVI